MILFDIKSKNGISYTDYNIQAALDKMYGKGALEVKFYQIFDDEIDWKARVRNGITKIEDLKVKEII